MDIKERRKQVAVETVQRTTQEVYLIILEQAHRNSQAHLRAYLRVFGAYLHRLLGSFLACRDGGGCRYRSDGRPKFLTRYFSIAL